MNRRFGRLTVTPLEDRSLPASLFTVNSPADTNARDGVLTLREALLAERGDLTGLDAGEAAQVQASVPGLTRDTVRFAAGLGGQTIGFTTNDATPPNRYGPTGFVVTTAVAVDGRAGTGRGVTLSGGGVQRLFTVTGTGDLTLTNLELVNGLAKGGVGGGGGGGAAGLGGAVFVDQGRLTVSASTLANNQAVGGAGGAGVFGGGGGLGEGASGTTGGGPNGGTLGQDGGFGGGGGGSGPTQYNGTHPTHVDAGAGGLGGGGGGGGATVIGSVDDQLYVYMGNTGGFGGGNNGFGGGSPAAATFITSLAGIGGGGGGGLGGAIFNDAGTVDVTSSTFTANTAGGGAGGVVVSVRTAVGGTGKGYGGAVFSRNGTLTITASTLAANTAVDGGTSVYVLADAVSGGDAANTGTATVALTDSVLTDLVTRTNGTAAVVTATGTTNLIQSTDVTTVGGLAADPLLGPLQDNGGPTRTMAPAVGSLVVNAVVGGMGTDQRGLPRADGLLDLGAVEVQNPSPGGPAALTPTALPAGTTSIAYPATAVTATGPFGPWTFAVTAGALPPGLTLPPTGPFAHTTYLSGTPTTAGTYTFTVTATSGGATARQAYTVAVAAAPAISPATLPAAVQGTAYSATFAVTGSPGTTTYAATAPLPPGLSLSSAGVLSGTPTTAGVYTFTVTATTAAYGPVRHDYTLAVDYPPVAVTPATLPAGQVGTAYSQTLSASGGAGSPYAFGVTAGSLPSGLALSGTGVLAGTPTTSGTFTFTVTATAADGQTGTRDYSLAVVPPVAIGPATLPGGRVSVPYGQTLTAAGPAGPYTFAVAGGALPPGLTLSAAGVLAGTPTTEGNFTFVVAATSAAGWTGSRTFNVPIGPAPAVTVGPAALPDGVLGEAYAQAVTATGETPPYTFAVTAGALPPGLALTAAGQLAGTPTAAGRYAFTVTAASADPFTGSHDYAVVVRPPVTIDPATLPTGLVGTAYAQTLTASGGAGGPFAFAVAAGDLPPGLSLSPAGVLAGTPTAEGKFTFTATATAAVGPVGTRTYTLAVNYPPITITPATLPGGQVGTPYSQTLTASGGGGGPYVFVGTAPPGLSLSAAGVLAGTPTTAGTFNLTFTVTSAGGQAGSYTSVFPVVPAVAIAPATLPGGRLTLAYDQALTASGPAGPYAFAVTAGALPPGLALSAGRITGTPTATGDYAVTVTATSADGWPGTRDYAVHIAPAPLVTVGPTALPDPQVGTPYDQTLAAAGEAAPYAFAAAGNLPPGLTLSPAGRLTGTPTTAGTYTFTASATSADPFTGSREYTVVVQPPVTVGPVLLPDDVVTVPYDQALTATGPVGPYAFAVTAGVLPTGLALSPTGRLSGTPTAIGGYTFTVTATSAGGFSGSRDYTIAIVAPGTVTVRPATLPDAQVGTAYGQPVTAFGEAGPFTFAVSGGALPDGLTLSPTTGELAGAPTTDGLFAFQITATSFYGFTGSRWLSLAVVPPVAVAPATLPGGRLTLAYTQTLTASGPAGPYTFAVAGTLPPGLTLTAAGVLAGVPAAVGDYAFDVTATSADGWAGTRDYAITVGRAPAVTVGPAALPDPHVGTAYDQTLAAAGEAAPYTFAAAGTLPPGLTLSPAGRLTGTPTAAGSYLFTVSATSSDPFAGSRDYTLVVQLPVTVGPGLLPDAVVTVPYAQTLTASGPAGPYTFALSGGSLPPGLTLSPGGQLAGTPTATGDYPFTVTATNAAGWVGTLGVRLAVGSAPAVTVGPAALPDPQVGTAYDRTLAASGGAAPYTFAASGALPPGLTLSADGRLTGTPTDAGRYAFTVTATSADGFTGGVPITLTVNPATQIAPSLLPAGVVGDAYKATLAAGPGGPYTFAVTGGRLPPGLALSLDGQLAGTPTAAGSFAFTVTATTPADASGRQDHVIAVGPVVPPVPPVGTPTAVGGSDGTLTVLGPDGRPVAHLTPFPGFAGGVRVAELPDGRVAAGTGPGRATGVKLLDPATGATLFDLAPFEPAFTGGVFVSAGDLFGTGTPQLVVSPDEGGGPRVRVIDPATGAVRLDFFGIDDPAFRGGARTAVGDVTGDGVPDLIVAAGFGGGPRVTVWDGLSLRAGTPRAVANFFAFEDTLRNGAYVAAGDLDGDGFADVVFGGGPGGGPRVLALSGRDVAAGAGSPGVLANFFAGDATNRGGVPVAAKDVDGDGRPDVIAGTGPGGGGTVRAFAGRTVGASQPGELFAYDAGDLMNGVYVG